MKRRTGSVRLWAAAFWLLVWEGASLALAATTGGRMLLLASPVQALGRLLDIDVIAPDGGKISRTEIGLPARRCLLCGNPAPVCARSRAHSADAQRTGSCRRQDFSAFTPDNLRSKICGTNRNSNEHSP